MSYSDQLHPWVIYRRLPNLQRQAIERFRRRNDAEHYLKAMQRLSPAAEFELVYEVDQGEGRSRDASDLNEIITILDQQFKE